MPTSSLYSRLQQVTSGVLIFVIMFLQTVQMSWFDVARADQSDYYDIVSIFVDESTYRQLRPDILQYASDIQAYLPDTRTSIHVVSPSTPPPSIVAINEKLFYEGDGGGGVSHLVGTILIGDVPLPIVKSNGKAFPSIFPYVDFRHKSFIFDTTKEEFLIHDSLESDDGADIWHGVIDPNLTGNMTDQDFLKLRGFFEKTHRFYTKSGNFSKFLTQEPRVFYHDAKREFSGLSLADLYAYILSMEHVEDITFSRYSHYFAQYLITAIDRYNATLEDTQVTDFLTEIGYTGSTSISTESLTDIPDIQTEQVIKNVAKKFSQIMNGKSLGEMRDAVHNAGRYNSGTQVRVDITPVDVTTVDTASALALRKANEELEQLIDRDIARYARKIALFDSLTITHTGSIDPDTGVVSSGYTTEDRNYFFGTEARKVGDPNQCTIARGSNHIGGKYQDGILVEANQGYDLRMVEGNAKLLAADSEILASVYKNQNATCFPKDDEIRLLSYWGKNSGLNLGTGGYLTFRTSTTLSGFSLPIFSLGGMRETDRFDAASPLDCTSDRYQYTLRQPYTTSQNNANNRFGPSTTWPELGRFTCITQHISGNARKLATEYSRYTRSPQCFVGTLTLDGKTIASSYSPCITYSNANGGDGGQSEMIDSTIYEDQEYHTIPSIVFHKSPTVDEYESAKKNGATQSLAIDHDRYVEFLTPKGQLARIMYPNFFRIEADSVEEFRRKLGTLVSDAWSPIISNERNATDSEENIAGFLVTGSLPLTPPDWNQYLSDETISTILQIRKWLHADPYKKYTSSMESMLSLSHGREGGTGNLLPAIIPNENTRSVYDIAYLSLGNFTQENTPSDLSDIIQSIDIGRANIVNANLTETGSEVYSNSDSCGPVDGVELQKWFPAVLCWLKSLLPPRISAGSCGGKSFMNSSSSLSPQSPVSMQEADGRYNFLVGGSIELTSSRKILYPGESLALTMRYIKSGQTLDLLSTETAQVEILKITDPFTQKVLYDELTGSGNNISEIFSVPHSDISFDHGIASVGVRAGMQNVDVTLRAHMKPFSPGSSSGIIEAFSDPLTLSIRDERLEAIQVIDGIESGGYQVGSGVFSLLFSVKNGSGEVSTPAFPIDITLSSASTKEILFSGSSASVNFSVPENISQKAGLYSAEYRDALGRVGRSDISFLPNDATTIVINPYTPSLVRGLVTPVLVSLEDAYGNRVDATPSTIHIAVSNGYILLPSGEKVTEAEMTTIEGFALWSIGSDGEGDIRITAYLENSVISAQSRIQILPGVRVNMIQSGPIVAGGEAVSFILKISDTAGNALPGVSTFASLTAPESLGFFHSGTIALVDGISSGFLFTPQKQSGTFDATLHIPGIIENAPVPITIFAGPSMYGTLEDNIQSGSVFVTLRDRYGNATIDSLQGSYTYYGAESNIPFSIINGKATLPRKSGYLHVHIPSLETASFTVSDAVRTITIPGVPDAILSIAYETALPRIFSDYNSIYTVLPGDNYTALASEMLYSTDPMKSVSLAVTTLLSNPSASARAFTLDSRGNLSLNTSATEHLYQANVLTKNGIPFIRVIDDFTHAVVGEITPTFSRARLIACSTHDTCLASGSTSAVILTPLDPSFIVKQEHSILSLSFTGESSSIFSINQSLQTSLRDGVSVRLAEESHQLGLTIIVSFYDSDIATLVFVPDAGVSPTLEESAANDTFHLTISPQYYPEELRDSSLGETNHGYDVLERFSADVTSLDTSIVGPNGKKGFERIHEEGAIGWGGTNTALLHFAGGETVGNATKWESTYLMINLGDPVAHLTMDAPGVIKNGLDRTLGIAINGSGKGNITSYKSLDMDNDGYNDLVVYYDTNYVELFLNEKGRFRSRGYIASLPEGGGGTLETGDFTGDRYGDLFVLSDKGKISLIDNSERKLRRIPIHVLSGDVPHNVTQLKAFDMDGDARTDIVYLTESGELGVLYGTSTAGIFIQNVLERDLGVSLSSSIRKDGGALYYDSLPQLPPGLIDISELANGSGANEALIRKQVYFQRVVVEAGSGRVGETGISSGVLASVGTTEWGEINQDLAEELATGFAGFGSGTISGSTAPSLKTITYIRSEYGEANNIRIERSYSLLSGEFLRTGSPVRATVVIRNTGTETLRSIEYLEKVPSIFSTANTKEYTLDRAGKTQTGTIDFLDDEFSLSFHLPDIPPGTTHTLTYTLTTLPITYGKLLVGKFESGEVGDDLYGDIAFDSKSTCGSSILIWRSVADREYQKGTRDFSQGEFPDELKQYFIDTNKNGIPDFIENMSIEERQKKMDDLKQSSDPQIVVDPISTDNGNLTVTIGLTPELESKINTMVDTLTQGFSCGFGGGSCLSFPLNWAPLAPGSTPSIFGIPLGFLSPSTGVPIFSSITGIPLYGPWGCIPVPTVWPVSPIGYTNTCGANLPSAGGYLGTWDPTNTVRIYITPTLTLGMGEAICFGGPAIVKGKIPPQGVSPLVPGGNCIVIAHPMPFCKEDGSDGDAIGASGLGTFRDTWNASSCTFDARTSASGAVSENLRTQIIDYIRNPSNSALSSLSASIASAGSAGFSAGPLVNIGAGEGAIEVDISVDSRKGFSFQDIVKIKNKSVSAFPDFIMNWVDRQIEEIVNKFLTLPTLTIVLPQPSQNWSIVDFSKGWNGIAQSINSSDQKAAFPQNTKSFLPKNLAYLNTSGVSTSIANGTHALRSAYEFIGKLPFVHINTVNIPLSVPWITGEDIDKAIMSYKLQYESYESTVLNALKNWCAMGNTPECVNAKLHIDSSTFLSDLAYNIQMLESYKRFPEKLQKLLTWKQRLIDQITCNIDAVEQMVGGWLRDNSRRFRAWVEAIVLLRAILNSWQPILDLFADYQKNCTVCRNERYDLKYFIFKIISALIPELPVIRFPKWPDIVLDLHDIRAGIRITVPEFSVQPIPIRLPTLPSLSLPTAPNASIVLPSIPRLPALPEIPDLPELPSFPTITLPNLPPPPKLPKLFGSIAGVLKILRVVEKVMCLLRKEIFVPEWRAGDVIAQRTERQGTLPIDFLDIQFPELSLSFMKEIRVATHVNFEYKTEFLAEMARSLVAPLNTFSTNMMQNVKVSVPDLPSIPSPESERIQLYNNNESGSLSAFAQKFSHIVNGVVTILESEKDDMVSVDELKTRIRYDLEHHPEIYTPGTRQDLLRALSDSDFGTEKLTQSLIDQNTQRFQSIRASIPHEDSSILLFLDMFAGKSHSGGLVMKSEKNFSPSTSNSFISVAHAERDSHEFSPIHNKDEDVRLALLATQERELTRIIASIPQTPRRLAYESETLAQISPNISGGNPSTATPTMNFQGIYVLDDAKKQTRLFDWIDALDGSEEVILDDIDRDGDQDFIFRVGNTLSWKSRHTQNPLSTYVSDPPSLQNDLLLPPTALNNLKETIISPNSINITWSPVHSYDRVFRIGFYDRFLEFDNEMRRKQEFPEKYIVDAVVTEKTGGLIHSGTMLRDRSILFVRSVRGDVALENPGVRPVTAGSIFSVSALRSLYTGDAPLSMSFAESGGNPQTVLLEPFMRYIFQVAGDVRIFDGKGYIEDYSASEITPRDMIGMPLIPGVTLKPMLTGASIEIATPLEQISRLISYPAQYQVIDIGNFSPSYTAHFDIQNGWYYSEVYALGSQSTRAKTVLMSPSEESDRDGPLVHISDTLSIPVYTPYHIPVNDLVSDRSTLTLLWDTDTRVDSDGDGNTQNDFLESVPGVLISDGFDVTFGPFSSLGERSMLLHAIDGNGNISEKPFTLSVYAPIPQIDSFDPLSGLSGSIDTIVEGVPIDLLLYRNTSVTHLPVSALTDSEGKFHFPLSLVHTRSGSLTIQDALRSTVITIDPQSGKMNTIPQGTRVVVEPASLETAMKMTLLDTDGGIIASQKILLPDSLSFVNEGTGIIVETGSGYRFIENSYLSSTLPGGGFLVGNDQKARIGIARDGNIYVLDSSVTLAYNNDMGEFLAIDVFIGLTRIARVVYRVNFHVIGR